MFIFWEHATFLGDHYADSIDTGLADCPLSNQAPPRDDDENAFWLGGLYRWVLGGVPILARCLALCAYREFALFFIFKKHKTRLDIIHNPYTTLLFGKDKKAI